MQLETIIRRSFTFGLTSGIITTLGLMVGLDASTNSRLVVLGGIFTIAIADAFSDAFGMHISEESEDGSKSKDIWGASIVTFVAKLVFALTFTVPVLLFPLSLAIAICVGWGFLLLGLVSARLAFEKKTRVIPIVAEHWTIALVVIALTYLVGQIVKTVFAG